MFDDYETPEDRLERWANTEWTIVTLKGYNPDGELETRDVQMSGNIELAVKGWGQMKEWTNVEIVEQTYIGKVPPANQFN